MRFLESYRSKSCTPQPRFLWKWGPNLVVHCESPWPRDPGVTISEYPCLNMRNNFPNLWIIFIHSYSTFIKDCPYGGFLKMGVPNHPSHGWPCGFLGSSNWRNAKNTELRALGVQPGRRTAEDTLIGSWLLGGCSPWMRYDRIVCWGNRTNLWIWLVVS